MKKKEWVEPTVVLVCFSIIILAVVWYTRNLDTAHQASNPEPVEVFFDAMLFWEEVNYFSITEEGLIDLLGPPDEIVEWRHTDSDVSYCPIRTLCYEQNLDTFYGHSYAYHFNGDRLQRIRISGVEVPYSQTADILKMFNIKRYPIAEIVDNGFSYRATKCNVRQLWVTGMSDEYLTEIVIDYGSVFLY